jgi:hypothetical protein
MQAVLTKASIPSFPVNYHPIQSAAGPFLAYRGLVNRNIQKNLLAPLRTAGVAVTVADVVAHSMGGILTRMDANDPASLQPDNYDDGYIRRVITVDTPHWGATPAQLLLDEAQDFPLFNTELVLASHPVLNGAVQDLSPYYFAASSGGAGGAASAARQALE